MNPKPVTPETTIASRQVIKQPVLTKREYESRVSELDEAYRDYELALGKVEEAAETLLSSLQILELVDKKHGRRPVLRELFFSQKLKVPFAAKNLHGIKMQLKEFVKNQRSLALKNRPDFDDMLKLFDMRDPKSPIIKL